MVNFILFITVMFLLTLAYSSGFSGGARTVRKYIRGEVNKITTQYGEDPASHQSQEIVNDLLNFLNEYTDDSHK